MVGWFSGMGLRKKSRPKQDCAFRRDEYPCKGLFTLEKLSNQQLSLSGLPVGLSYQPSPLLTFSWRALCSHGS